MDIRITAVPSRNPARCPWRVPLSLILLAAGATLGNAVFAQATSTHIFGWGPAGQRVVVKSATGLKRTTAVNDHGRYAFRSLPMGVYTVSLMKGDTVVDTRPNIPLTIGRGAEVDFACDKDQCAASAN
ncbi:carboxypeptidase regulatory-like domain-containing protein [Dyella ginsengisoli]|uniref:Carboxypeptidase regulatory-like domain-containing protein n=1 Tax=Dyella ginsengisoli TaxID=363848 RepID=A0ABW8JTD6_9GAMM